MIFHAASFDDSGNLRVVDIWESEDQSNNFLNTRLKSYLQKVNVSIPKGEIFPIHNVNALQEWRAIKFVELKRAKGHNPHYFCSLF